MNYHNIVKDDMLNGEGLRVTLFVSGCNHNCPSCQNPQTHNPKSGILFDINAMCEIFEQIDQEHINGLTLSGGDPLYIGNRKQILAICKGIKDNYPDKTIWLYTGYMFETIKDLEILKYIDVLVDGRFIKCLADENYPYAGSTNQRIINVQKSLNENRIVLHKLRT